MERRRIRGDLIETFKVMKGLSGISREDLFSLILEKGTRGHSLRLQRKHSRLQIRAKYFSNRVVPYWNKLPEEVINTTTVKAFKKAVDLCWVAVYPELC